MILELEPGFVLDDRLLDGVLPSDSAVEARHQPIAFVAVLLSLGTGLVLCSLCRSRVAQHLCQRGRQLRVVGLLLRQTIAKRVLILQTGLEQPERLVPLARVKALRTRVQLLLRKRPRLLLRLGNRRLELCAQLCAVHCLLHCVSVELNRGAELTGCEFSLSLRKPLPSRGPGLLHHRRLQCLGERRIQLAASCRMFLRRLECRHRGTESLAPFAVLGRPLLRAGQCAGRAVRRRAEKHVDLAL